MNTGALARIGDFSFYGCFKLLVLSAVAGFLVWSLFHVFSKPK